MTFWFVFNHKILTLPAGQLLSARLFCVEMVKARLARNYFSIFCDF